jgi:hypothetical protein
MLPPLGYQRKDARLKNAEQLAAGAANMESDNNI